MIIYLPLLFALIGLLMYALCINPKLAEIGRLLFWTSWLAFMLNSGTIISVLRK
jgi:hypothetical protein